jgi:hypothetical protein
MVACPLHNAMREKRLKKEQNKTRPGEADPEKLFWSQPPKQQAHILVVSEQSQDKDLVVEQTKRIG